jgi:hypothetical protein
VEHFVLLSRFIEMPGDDDAGDPLLFSSIALELGRPNTSILRVRQ